MDQDFSMFYVTCSSKDEAVKISHELLSMKLIACANIHNSITSIYECKGEVCQEEEVLLILKTQTKHIDALTEKIKSLHSYECPCITSWNINSHNDDYSKWLIDQSN